MKKNLSILVIALSILTSVNAQNSKSFHRTTWQATISGNTELVLELSLKGNQFEMKSHKGSCHNIVTGNMYYLGRLTGKINARSVEIKGTQFMKNDTLFLSGEYQSLTATQSFNGFITNNTLYGELTNNTIVGKRIDTAKPVRNYEAIAQAIIDTTEQYLYNPHLLNSKEWQNFKTHALKVSRKVYDDYEFKYALNFQVRNLPFTHYGVSINTPQTETSSLSEKMEEKRDEKFNIQRIDKETVLFTVKTFSASAEEIEPYIDTLKTLNINNLIIDLRNNSGGTVASALPLAEFLIQDTLYGGTFLTKKYFSEHDEIPTLDELKVFPKFSEASFSKIISGIHNEKGLCLVIYPQKQNYKGNLYILTNRNTASTCEPFVYGFKTSKRATIVGETTYGGMLNGESFNITDEFGLWMPTADFYAADGFKIDKVGVTPNISVDPADALTKTMELIGSKN